MKRFLFLYLFSISVVSLSQNRIQEHNLKVEFMHSQVIAGDSTSIGQKNFFNSINFGYSRVKVSQVNKVRFETGLQLTFYTNTFKYLYPSTQKYYNNQYGYIVAEIPILFGIQKTNFYFDAGPTISTLIYFSEPPVNPVVWHGPNDPTVFGFFAFLPSAGLRANSGYQFIMFKHRISLELSAVLYKDFWNVNHYAKPIFLSYGIGLKYNFIKEIASVNPETKE